MWIPKTKMADPFPHPGTLATSDYKYYSFTAINNIEMKNYTPISATYFQDTGVSQKRIENYETGSYVILTVG